MVEGGATWGGVTGGVTHAMSAKYGPGNNFGLELPLYVVLPFSFGGPPPLHRLSASVCDLIWPAQIMPSLDRSSQIIR